MSRFNSTLERHAAPAPFKSACRYRAVCVSVCTQKPKPMKVKQHSLRLKFFRSHALLVVLIKTLRSALSVLSFSPSNADRSLSLSPFSDLIWFRLTSQRITEHIDWLCAANVQADFGVFLGRRGIKRRTRDKDLNGPSVSRPSPKSHYGQPPPSALWAAVVCREGNCIRGERISIVFSSSRTVDACRARGTCSVFKIGSVMGLSLETGGLSGLGLLSTLK